MDPALTNGSCTSAHRVFLECNVMLQAVVVLDAAHNACSFMRSKLQQPSNSLQVAAGWLSQIIHVCDMVVGGVSS